MDLITGIQAAQSSVDAVSQLIDSGIALGGKIIAISAPIAAVLPRPQNGGAITAIHKIVNLLAFNIHHAANHADIVYHAVEAETETGRCRYD